MNDHQKPPGVETDAHRVYIGYDPREHDAYLVAVRSLIAHSSVPLAVTPLHLARLETCELMKRTWSRAHGQMWDHVSDAPMSTEFAVSRFLTPILAVDGPALFMDCDMLVLGDVAELFALYDERYAVQVVKHDHRPTEMVKMDGQLQTAYRRKNWSSVALFNAGHPANRWLTVDKVNGLPGRDLHAFCWLNDADIGELPPAWNWLVGVQPKPEPVGIAHYTLGGPWLPDWEAREHDDLWIAERDRLDAQAHRSARR